MSDADGQGAGQGCPMPPWRGPVPPGGWCRCEYPTGHLRLAGAAWPWRPTTMLALTIAAAIGAGFLPAAAAHRNRP